MKLNIVTSCQYLSIRWQWWPVQVKLLAGSLKFPKYFGWSFLVEKCDWGFMLDYQMMLPPDISARAAWANLHRVSPRLCWRSAHVRLGCASCLSPLQNVHQSVTNKSAQSRSWRSRRHFQDWDLTYHHSGRDSEPSPRRVCTVTCCRKAFCALGADYYGMQWGWAAAQVKLYFYVSHPSPLGGVFECVEYPKMTGKALNISLGKCAFYL